MPSVAINYYFTSVKESVNPEIVKNIACCNFLIITVMYIKVNISGMEMSQRIHFLYQILPKMVKKICDKPKKIILS